MTYTNINENLKAKISQGEKDKKRILSIDGGGIRGIISLQILKRIEDIVCSPGSPYNCLADFFDLISGTSTGSIIASGLAIGMKVDKILELYVDHGEAIFKPQFFLKSWYSQFRGYKYDPKTLEHQLEETFKDITLGSDELKTLLLIPTRNVTQGGAWIFSNNPFNPYFNNNRSLLIKDLTRASSAAPMFFPVHYFNIKNHNSKEIKNGFIDGGITMFNNPAFCSFLQATEEVYGLKWRTKQDELLLISIGTGYSKRAVKSEELKKYNAIDWVRYLPLTMMDDANLQQNTLMKIISKTSTFNLDETKNENQENILKSTNQVNLLTYRRYTISFTEKRFQGLVENYNLSPDIKPDLLEDMDCVAQINNLCKVGEAVAKEQVSESIFNPFKI